MCHMVLTLTVLYAPYCAWPLLSCVVLTMTVLCVSHCSGRARIEGLGMGVQALPTATRSELFTPFQPSIVFLE